ncbi:C1 family peptidase [Kutzneria sp. CA-103260]|uniref:C1 family peptidase n=1 Tax=Kutzneria sp. CA-103260 TaxID=2802641 RepID=UPI001BA4CBCC|nr:C1 family peptidase [Kutzneria sp. CA-103260]QUQ69684.1 Papain family cysteine protease [Kutzneria sp. CA-103260]
MTSPTPRSVARYGWIPDLPDARDLVYAAPRAALANLPAKTDLRAGLPECYDQGQIGSCTANAIAGAFEFSLRKQGLADFTPSRLFIYYNERAMEGSVGTDSGAQIRDGVKSVAKQGVCPETEWPYEAIPADANGHFPAGSREATKPSNACYQDALKSRATTYQRVVTTLDQLRGCLAAGYPFVFGFSVYESFESQQVADSGVVPMPGPSEQLLGGHAVLAVGYDDASQRFLVRNSWGTSWGQQGHFTMPYAYLTERSLSSDFWTIRVVT